MSLIISLVVLFIPHFTNSRGHLPEHGHQAVQAPSVWSSTCTWCRASNGGQWEVLCPVQVLPQDSHSAPLAQEENC